MATTGQGSGVDLMLRMAEAAAGDASGGWRDLYELTMQAVRDREEECEGCLSGSWCRGGDCGNNAAASGARAE